MPIPNPASAGPRARRPSGVWRALLAAAALAAASPAASPAAANGPAAPSPPTANFHGETASAAVVQVADWATAANDARGRSFAVVDKVNARVFVFAADGALIGASAALLGKAIGDDSAPGIGERKLSDIRPEERTTPAGRFEAGIGPDLVRDVLWVDYDAAISMHRVVTGNAADRRLQRLATPTALDNRVSYGCINVPVRFYEDVILPSFLKTGGVVYVLPEVRPLRQVFKMPQANADAANADAGAPPPRT